jgi:hypothetical protein
MRYCFCVAGWYFDREFFEALYAIEGDKYVASHRDPAYFDTVDLPPGVREDLMVFPNHGLDWGLYYQFIEAVDVSPYDFVIFIHDDVVIKDPTFPQALAEKFADPRIKVIGNGRNGTDAEFRFEKYKDRMFWQEEDGFLVRTVRGSFFAARSDIFPVIGNFPVFWKVKPGPKQNKANISLRNFGYIVTKHFRLESITYLDEVNYLDTRYISELVRGEPAAATT